MNLEQAMDFLASNCPTVFAPISAEMERLGTENEGMKKELQATQNALNDLVFNMMNGGM